MTVWVGDSFAKDFGVDVAAIRAKAEENAVKPGSVTHEHLYASIMSMLGVKGSTYRAAWDWQK